MTVKHTKAVLLGKFNEYLKSITDEELRLDVKSSAIIAGGSIASLMQGEEYNDLDIYFDNKEVLEKLVKYYTNYWNSNHKSKVSYISKEEDISNAKSELISSLEENISNDKDNEYYEKYLDDNNEIDHEALKDKFSYLDDITIDNSGVYMFIKSKGYVEEKPSENDEEKPKYRPTFITDNAITLADNIQIITRFSGFPEDILKKFDYAHTLNYFIPARNEICLNKQALSSLLTKELIYVGSEFPLCSLFRMRKFINRGYTINAGQILKMVFQLNYLDLTDLKVLRKQLVGVDSTYMSWFIADMQEYVSTGGMVDNDYLYSLIGKLFDEEII